MLDEDSLLEGKGREGKGREQGGAASAPAAPPAQPSLLPDPEPPRPERPPKPADLQAAWNELAPPAGLPAWKELSRGREEAARARLRERGLADGPERPGWRTIIARIAASSFCRGQNARSWRADPDFLLQRDTAAKVLEGKYDDRRPNGTGPPSGRPRDVSRGRVGAEDVNPDLYREDPLPPDGGPPHG
jgi:hypothetical protein